MTFQNCSRFAISDANITNVEGNISYNILQQVELVERQQKRSTIWDEYLRIPTGEVYLVQKIAESRKYEDPVQATVTAHIVRIPPKYHCSETNFLRLSYRGRNAREVVVNLSSAWAFIDVWYQAFIRDFRTFSVLKDMEVVQLFGYSGSGQLPALIFYDALIPVASIFKQHRWSPFLYTYFLCRYNLTMSGFTGTRMSLGELWIDPRDATLRKGPRLEVDASKTWFLSKLALDSTFTSQPPSLEAYHDESAMFEYLSKTLSSRSLIKGASWAVTGSSFYGSGEEIISMLSSGAGSVFDTDDGSVIARWPELDTASRYRFHGVRGIPESAQERVHVMADRSIRFTLMASEVMEVRELELWYGLYTRETWHSLIESWLSQAPLIFDLHGISEEDWGSFAISTSFWLSLDFKELQLDPMKYIEHQDNSFYLFVRPVPSPADHRSVWESWMYGRKCYWSFDPFGLERPVTGTDIGPDIDEKVGIWRVCWDKRTYQMIRKLQILHGFDPATTEFAVSLGYSIFQGASDMDELRRGMPSLFEEGDWEPGEQDEVVVYPRRCTHRQRDA